MGKIPKTIKHHHFISSKSFLLLLRWSPYWQKFSLANVTLLIWSVDPTKTVCFQALQTPGLFSWNVSSPETLSFKKTSSSWKLRADPAPLKMGMRLESFSFPSFRVDFGQNFKGLGLLLISGTFPIFQRPLFWCLRNKLHFNFQSWTFCVSKIQYLSFFWRGGGRSTFKRKKFNDSMPYGCFLKWGYPTTMGFPAKNDHFGVFWGYHHSRKQPYICHLFFGGWVGIQILDPWILFSWFVACWWRRCNSWAPMVLANIWCAGRAQGPRERSTHGTWRIIPPHVSTYLIKSPSISHGWPFGKGTTPGIGDET